MPAIPELARILELDRFSNTVHIVETNHQELDRLLRAICDTPFGDNLFFTENWSNWQAAMAEIVRLLHNLAGSVATLINHCSFLYGRMYQVSGQFPEYEKEMTARFAKDEVIQFVQAITNHCLHHGTPPIGTTMRVVDLQSDKFEKKVTLTREDLLNFEWNEAAMRFIDLAPRSIDLRQTLDAHRKSIRSFSDWFSRRTRILSARDYQAVNEYVSANRETTRSL